MTLKDIGEFGFISRLHHFLRQNIAPGNRGIGDDCAVLDFTKHYPGQKILVSTDLLVEDVHFIFSKIRAQDLGYKSLAVNLSDIAAMGGTPVAVFLGLSLPSRIKIRWLDDFFMGWKSLASLHKIHLLGGDTTGSLDRITISVTILGVAPQAHIKLRSAAKPRDVICCTGFLGDAGLGLKAILDPRFQKSLTPSQRTYFLKKHHRPLPHIAQGQWLAQQQGVHAMMDLSDGLDSDLRRILEQSRCGARIDLGQVPLSPLLRKVAQKYKIDVLSHAVSSGEDYQLLLTVAPRQYPQVASRFLKTFGTPLFQLGEITTSPINIKYFQCGRLVKPQTKNFDHFKS